MKTKSKLNFFCNSFVFSVVQAAFISLLVLSLVYNVSCRISTEGIHLLSGDFESPELLGVHSASSNQILVDFSEDVKVNGITLFEAPDQYDFSSLELLGSGLEGVPLDYSFSADGKQISCNLLENTKIGQKYILYGTVEDKNGNTLTFSSFVVGYNSNPATIVFSEIQRGKTSKGISEFVEFYVLAPGNLAGLVVSSISDGEEFDYVFPSVEVNAKDIVVLHLRKTEDGCISEFENDLSLSTATGSNNSARDIWAENTEKPRFGSSQDVILLTDGNSGSIKDCFMYSRSTNNAVKTEWGEEKFKITSKKAVECGLWQPNESFDNAFIFTLSSGQFNFKRKNISELEALAEKGLLDFSCIPVRAADWERISASKVTPGSL